jgi:predicted RNase H-like HicB family nuclease
MEYSIEIFKGKDNTYIASCPKLDIYGYGESIDHAIDRLRNIFNFYVESAQELGITLEELCLSSFDLSSLPKKQNDLSKKELRYLH